MNHYLKELYKDLSPDPRDKVFSDIWKEYERVVVHSILTTFGLDFLIHDQDGGDVDTVHNVKQTGLFKNSQYKEKYDGRGKYNPKDYHTDDVYVSIVKDAKRSFVKDAQPVADTYVEGRLLYFSKGAGLFNRPALDHVISACEIHNDPVRMLTDIDGISLANNPDNLKFTNMYLNLKMSDKSIEGFIEWCDNHPEKVNWDGTPGKTIPDDVRQKLIEEDKKARDSYYKTIEKDYYSKPQFFLDSALAAGRRGVEMGLRQVLGLVLLEIWISCKSELCKIGPGTKFEECIYAIKHGINKGIMNSLNKYDKYIDQFGQGFVAGVLSSLETTLINIFVTTEKNTVKYIRYGCTSIVQSCSVLLINPNDLLLGDQLKQATIILGTGATNIIGSYVGDQIAKTSLGSAGDVGEYVIRGASVLVSGLLSCTLLILLDRSRFINSVVGKLNEYVTVEQELIQVSEKCSEIAAELLSYDLQYFVFECKNYTDISLQIINADSEKKLESVLESYFISSEQSLPWEGDFDEFMSDRSKPWNF